MIKKNKIILSLIISVFLMFTIAFINITTSTAFAQETLSGIEQAPLGVMGDMDGDGDADTVDLIIVQRSIGSITDLSGNYALDETQRVLADINRDGEVTIIDCQLIRNYIVGLLNSLDYGGEQAPVFYNITVLVIDHHGSGTSYKVEVQDGVSLLEQLKSYAERENLDALGYYHDTNKLYEITADDLPEKNMEVNIFLNAPEAPREYSLSVNHIDEYGMTIYDGNITVPAESSVMQTLTQMAESYDAEILGFYTDSSFQTQIPENYTAAEYYNEYGANVWVVLAPTAPSEYTLTFYLNGVQYSTQTVPSGENLLSVVNSWYNTDMGQIDGVYYDAEKASPVDSSDLVDGDKNVYVYTVTQEVYAIELYKNELDGKWTYFDRMEILEGTVIKQALREYFASEYVYFSGIYYDEAMTLVVGENDTLDGSISVYIYSEVKEDVGGEDAEDFLYVRIQTANGEQIGYEQISTYEGNNIVDAIKARLNVKTNISIVYDDGANTVVSSDAVYSKGDSNAFIVTAYKVEVVFCEGVGQTLHSGITYGFEGEELAFRVNEIISKYITDGQGMSVFADSELTTPIGETISGDVTVYALINNQEQAPSAYYNVTLVQVIGGINTGINGFSGEATVGNEIVSSISSQVQSMVGFIYNIVGYYYDEDCTLPVGNGTFTEGDNEIYIKVEVKDLSGAYLILNMQDDSEMGTLTLSAGNTATFTLGEDDYSGTYSVIQGMVFVSVKTYSQYVFVLMEMQENVVAVMALDFNGENKPVQEKYSAVAGEYVWYLEERGDNGEITTEECSLILYANGVHETTARGMAIRGEYDIVYENIVAVSVMGEVQHFNLDKQTGVATENYLAEYVGTHSIEKVMYSDGTQTYITIGQFTVNYDGTATYTLDGEPVACTATVKAGSLYLSYGEYDMIRISNYGINDRWGYYLDLMFDGNDYVVDSVYDSYVGSFAFKYYQENYQIEFYSNGVYRMSNVYGVETLGKYEIGDGYVMIYRDLENGWFEELAYSESQGAYVLRHTLEESGEIGKTTET